MLMSESVRNVQVGSHTLGTFVINLLVHICRKAKIALEITGIIAASVKILVFGRTSTEIYFNIISHYH